MRSFISRFRARASDVRDGAVSLKGELGDTVTILDDDLSAARFYADRHTAAECVKRLRRRQSSPRSTTSTAEEVMVIGDNFNDLEMLEYRRHAGRDGKRRPAFARTGGILYNIK